MMNPPAANIKVAVRIRPLLDEEAKSGHGTTKLEIDQDQHSIK